MWACLIEREGFGKDGVSYWSLPPSILVTWLQKMAGNRHTCSPNEVSKYDKHGGDGGSDRPEIGPTAADDAQVAYEERAAIREYNGGLDREEAEEAAAKELGWPEMPKSLRRTK